MSQDATLISNVVHIAQLIAAHVLAGGLGYSARYVQERLRRRRQRRNIEMLFGLSDRFISVVHSAVFDEQRLALNFPSSDMLAARIVAHLLEKTGRVEGRNFEIVPADEFERIRGSVRAGPEVEIITICGPKRNSVAATVLQEAPPLRYRHQIDANGHSIFADRELNVLISSANADTQSGDGSRTDFGVIQSIRNPFNTDCRITMLSGLHGAGTAGVAQVLSDPARVADICRRRKGDIAEELVKVIWRDRPEHLTSASIVK